MAMSVTKFNIPGNICGKNLIYELRTGPHDWNPKLYYS